MTETSYSVTLNELSARGDVVRTVRVIRTYTRLDLATAKHLWDEARDGNKPVVHRTRSAREAQQMVSDLNQFGNVATVQTVLTSEQESRRTP